MAYQNALVNVKQGQLRGVAVENVYGGRYLAFRGIPYAKPPVGSLRFQDPQPPEPWAGIKYATKFGDVCAQYDLLTAQLVGSDDCLYLNVYRPATDSPTKRAVMVWIHGGAFKGGSGNNDVHGPDYLVRKDIVLVTINYRLGILGFVNMEHEVATGNQGLKDQVMALKWVQENIAEFGGDPDNVTIFGSSAGASSVHYLTVSPLSQGLFHKAIAQSGVATNPWAIVSKDPSKCIYRLAAKLGEKSNDPKTVIEFLRKQDAQKLVAAEDAFFTKMRQTLQEPNVTFGAVSPSIDTKSPNPFMPQHPSLLTQNGVNVPFMLGYNENEGNFLISLFNIKLSKEYIKAANTNFQAAVPFETQKYMKKAGLTPMDLKRMYLGTKQINQDTMVQYSNYLGDVFFVHDIHNIVDVQLEKSSHPTYFYKFTFDDQSLYKKVMNITLPGASHVDETDYLFYSHHCKKVKLEAPVPGSARYIMMEYFTQMWTDFAKTGNPTPEPSELISTVWAPIEKSDSYNYLNINTTLKMENASRKSQRFNWKERKNKL